MLGFGRSNLPVAFVLLLAASQCSFAGKQFLAGPRERVVPDQLLVGLHAGANINQVISALPSHSVIAVAGGLRNAYRLKLKPGTEAAVSQLLAADLAVNYVEPNRIRSTTVVPPNDSMLTRQWNLTTVQAWQAWNDFPDQYLTAATASENRVKVAILDSGVDCTHPDFMNAGGASTDSAQGGQLLWASSAAIQTTTISPAACSWEDDNGHGTHVAGIVGAATNNATGVASLGFLLQLVVIKTSDENGNASDFDIAEGITAAINAGAQVISLSLGSAGYSQTLQAAIDAAWQNNILVVAAAGDTGDSTLIYPGAGNHVLGVAATDATNSAASFSTYGEWVKIAAPGVNILSTLPTYGSPLGANYGSFDGTSTAAPQVAALGGLLFAANPGISAAAAAERIQQTAQSPNTEWNEYIGYGVINAAAALGGVAGPFTQGGLTGQVVDLNDNPITGAVVTAGTQSYTTALDLITESDNGLFRINLPPGTYPIAVTASGHSTVNLQGVVVAGADTMLTIQMDVPSGEFTGLVTHNGIGVAGAVVQAVSASNNLIVGTSITSSSGGYALFVQPGSYTLTASAPNYINATSGSQSVSASGVANVNLALSALGNIFGAVTDANGMPVANAHIDFTNGAFSGGATTGPGGSYSTFGIPTGMYTVTASASGYSNVTVDAVFVTANVSTPIYPQFSTGVSLTTGLLGYWPFNEGSGSVAYDQSGNLNKAALVNVIWTTGQLFPYALMFNGSGSYGVTPPISFTGGLSASVWVNSGNPQNTSSGIVQTSSSPGWFLGVDQTATQYKFIVNGAAGSTGACASQSGCAQGGAITSGWHMVTGAYDGVTAILYLDGVMMASDTFTGANLYSPLQIGLNWTGAMQSLVVYNRALTASEVSTLFVQGTSTSLSLLGTTDSADVPAGSPVGYTLAVSNSGPLTAVSAALSDVLPTGPGISWSISPAYNGPGTCWIANGTLTCSLGDLPPGGTASIHVTSATSAGSCGTYNNTASLTATDASAVQASAFTIVQCSQTINFGPLSDQVYGTRPYAITATASSDLPVSLTSLAPSVCSVSGIVVTLLSAGTCTIQATQAGNWSYFAAPPVNQSFTVTSAIASESVGSLSFSNTIVGKSSVTQTFSLQNIGNSALFITSIALTGADAANYQYTADTVHPCPISPSTLSAGTTCILDVVFAPLSQGSHNNAQIAITDNSGNVAGATQSVGLLGTGIVLSSIAVSAGSSSLTYGSTEQFTATGTYSDNSPADLTSQVTWGSSATGIATISSGGRATPVAAGQTNVTATLSGVTSNSFQLTVLPGSPVSIAVSSGSGQSATVGTPFVSPLQALVKDGGGNVVPNVSVTFTAPSNGAGVTFGNGTTTYVATTNGSGIATSLAPTANAAAGSYYVTAAAMGTAGVANFTLTNLNAPALTIAETSVQPFVQGENAVFIVTVANAANAGPTSGPVTVTESGPNGFNLTGMNGGPAWNCNLLTASCATNAVLNPGSTYPSITVTFNVGYNVQGSVSNSVSVTGVASPLAIASNPAVVLGACDVNDNGNTTVTDVQEMINEALGIAKPAYDLNGDGVVNAVDVQLVVNAVMGMRCSA